jgi:hypothetical protein
MVAASIHQTTGFVPNKLLAWSLNALSFSLERTTTHTDMSREAILQVAKQFLIDNPNPEDGESTVRISALPELTEETLVTAYYGRRQPSRTRTFRKALREIGLANSGVDFGSEEEDAAAHFDSEQFQTGQNRLVQLRQNIETQISNMNFALARTETGRLLHALQDFYSHSNWVENGNTDPYDVLGRQDERPSNIAGPSTRTCRDCSRFRINFRINILNTIAQIIVPFDCEDNIRTSLLTSGYFTDQRDVNGNIIDKPRGKCSHGGFLDQSSNLDANGGINKDSPFDVWSPHFQFHNDAVSVARLATMDILNEIRADVNSDSLFGEYLGLDILEEISIAFVIDTTESMAEELLEIEATVPFIRQYVDSLSGDLHARYILVPFNDPGM